jgi:hypothetical protein
LAAIVPDGHSMPAPYGHEFVDYDHHLTLNVIQGNA